MAARPPALRPAGASLSPAAPLPQARGPLGERVRAALAGPPRREPGLDAAAAEALERAGGPGPALLTDEDVQSSLAMLYDLHYRGFAGVDDGWEWHPDLLAARAVLERAFEAALRAWVPVVAIGERAAHEPVAGADAADAVRSVLPRLVEADDGPSLAAHLDRHGTLEQYREFLAVRSVYHLKEADPHAWAIPRLGGRAKAALVEIEADEYGGGRPERMHAALFARTMRALGLDDAPGRYLDAVPAVGLLPVNAMSLFGLHRRLRGAIVGHLAVFEMTSSLPNRRYGNGLRRLGFDADATWFFDEHVEADAVHEQIALHDLAAALVTDEPSTLPDVLFGGAAALALDGAVARHLLEAWEQDRSALRSPLALADPAARRPVRVA